MNTDLIKTILDQMGDSLYQFEQDLEHNERSLGPSFARMLLNFTHTQKTGLGQLNKFLDNEQDPHTKENLKLEKERQTT